ncbi:MAG: RNA polymerase sporulation sigma factor SigE [Tissierellia bacterium]|nr:RNA polymerase sporulation sigma factor SigE [Tissierellia bacterium]MDD4725582.1 RNA polymerase sporulation sigma factor SigE [Tissierellia bacterium]
MNTLKYKIKLVIYKFLKKLNLLERIDYIGTGESLPPPLNPEEELYYLNNLKKDESIKGILIERNLRLVVYIARKFDNTKVSIEDLISIGTIGLIKAVNTFDPDKKIKLATYASKCIENEILMYLRKNSKLKNEISFDEPLNTDWDGNELLLSDILGTEGDIVSKNLEEQVDKTLLSEAIEKLSMRERTIVELRYGLSNGLEKTQKEVADILGISQSYISRLEKRIIKRLRKEMGRLL